jgi:hypothetical protein
MLQASRRAHRGLWFFSLWTYALIGSAAVARAEESWDAIYVGAFKVGHNHIRVDQQPDRRDPTKKYLRVQVNTVLSFVRNGNQTQMEMRYGTIETLEGSVLRLETRTLTGQDELQVKGELRGDEMHLELIGGGQRAERMVPWGGDIRGPYGAEQSLAHEPLKPGESRDVKMYIPDMNEVVTTHLKAKEDEKVALGGGEVRTLLRVEQTFTGADGKPRPELETTFWVDKGGQVLKSHSALLGGMDMYRTTEKFAKAPNDRFDLTAATIVKTKVITNSDQRRDIVYRVTLKDADPKEVFPEDRRQSLRPGKAPGQALLVVKTAADNRVGPAEDKPDPACLRPNPLINSEDSVVLQHMREAVGERVDPWAKAVAIEEWVFKNMRRKNFNNAFAGADEVARNLEGDCTEHGVLVAAMCRAAGIPCRCCVGFVYTDQYRGFGFHLWNEVYINDRWVAIDAAFNESEVDATHIKLATTSLDGVAPFEPFLPVIRLHGRLKLEPIEVR